MDLRLTLDTLKTIEKMDVQVPRKPKKLADKPPNGEGKRKVAFKEDGSLERGNIPPNYVPSVISTVEPKQLTILEIVENIRKTVS